MKLDALINRFPIQGQPLPHGWLADLPTPLHAVNPDALAAIELTDQLDALDDGCTRTHLFVSASSCGTLAGLLLGLAMLERTDVSLFGVSADASSAELRATSLELSRAGADLLEAEVDLGSIALTTIDDQIGHGYGIPTAQSDGATALFGSLEGMVLDPTYTAKAAAGMIDWIRSHDVPADERVVFLHTGGHPGLLA